MNQLFKLCFDNRTALLPATPQRELFISNEAGQSITIRGVIAEGFESNAADFTAALGQADPSRPLTINFNTPGGDVFEGKEIAAALRNYSGHTIANITSLCASAGTWVAIECSEVVMQKGAFFMIHNAHGMAWGDKKALRDRADVMEKVELSIVDTYVEKTGKAKEEVVTMMDAETWMTADEALENGFVDRVANGGSVTNTWNLSAYAKAPAALVAPAVEPVAEPKNEVVPEAAPEPADAPEPAPEPVAEPAPEPPAPSMTQSNRNRLALLQATP